MEDFSDISTGCLFIFLVIFTIATCVLLKFPML